MHSIKKISIVEVKFDLAEKRISKIAGPTTTKKYENIPEALY